VTAPAAQVLTTPSVDSSRGKMKAEQQAPAHIEQAQLLILRMEQRLQTREEKLV